MVVTWLLQCLFILLSVAFFTLFERKVMGLFHLRLGPNKVSVLGLLQPLLDAFKLLSKQSMSPFHANKALYNVCPIMSLFLSLFIWMTLPLSVSSLSMVYSVVLFFCLGSFVVFLVLLSGWSSNSKYSLMGSLRSVAQAISYEAVLSTLVVLIMLMASSYSIKSFLEVSNLLILFLLPLWFICALAETHRAPFDFSESESELVSGFNTEYSGAYFAFIFLSEYAILLYSSVLMVYVFGSFLLMKTYFILVVASLLIMFIFIWVRVTFCRFRYDHLMMAAWKILLPMALGLFALAIVII